MKTQSFFLSLLLIPAMLSAQETIIEAFPAAGQTGIEFPGTNMGLSQVYLLGEVRTGTRESSGFTLIEGFLQPDILCIPASASTDSVWPGDTNDDGVADMYDLLPIGVAFGDNGPVRSGATLNWQAQLAPPWASTLVDGTNYKHIDVDGNGTINADDTLGIILNYGLTHNKWEPESTTGVPLYMEFTEDTLMTGDTAHLWINLGTDTVPAQDVYGLAFSFLLDTTLVDPSTLKIDFLNSWMGTEDVDLLTLAYPYAGNELVDVALTRTDQQDVSGFGAIAHVSIIMIDDLAGKNFTAEVFRINLKGVRGISSNERQLDITMIGDSLILYQPLTGIAPRWARQIQVYPNPAQTQFRVDLGKLIGHRLHLYHINGQGVLQQEGRFRELLVPVGKLSAGVYLLTIETDKGTFRKRMILETISD